MEILVDINNVFQELFVYFIIGAIGVGAAFAKKWFSGITTKQDKMQTCLNNVNDRGIRHAKGLLEIGEHLDEEVQRLHPDRSPRPLKSRLERIITDDKGNL